MNHLSTKLDEKLKDFKNNELDIIKAEEKFIETNKFVSNAQLNNLASLQTIV